MALLLECSFPLRSRLKSVAPSDSSSSPTSTFLFGLISPHKQTAFWDLDKAGLLFDVGA